MELSGVKGNERKRPRRWGFSFDVMKRVARRAWRESGEDNVLGAAAELGYYFLLALFPMLIFLTSLIGFLPDVQESIFHQIRRMAPPEAMRVVSQTMQDVASNSGGGLLSFGILGTLWAASTGTAALIDTLNRAYEVKETRSYWKVRLIALGLTLGLSLVVVIGSAIIMLSDRLPVWIGRLMGVSGSWLGWWTAVDYLLGLALLVAAAGTIFRFGPDLKGRCRWLSPGAVFAAVASAFASWLFSVYLRVAPSYSATYGSLGAVIVLMLWLYLIGLVILIGGEINNEIEKLTCEPKPAPK
ncbi:MAG TPA: YihY/virulence factor BrkB family protein [Blastocatellia bacterium]|nr:YihY/virulence factor BrkB family protein [Blastocatellia bacterium]